MTDVDNKIFFIGKWRHFLWGIEYFDERQEIINFYCVENKVKKEDETTSLKKYCELRDGAKAFYI